MDVDAELSFEVLCNAGSRPPSRVLPLLGRISFQEPLDLFPCLFAELARTPFALSVIQAGGTFLIEAVDPLVDGRMRDRVQVRNLRGRTPSIGKQNHVGAHRHPADFLTFHAVEFLKLFIGGLASGSMRHVWKAECKNQGRENSTSYIDSVPQCSSSGLLRRQPSRP